MTKSPTPDMDGDSIGGAVNLVSKSAFDSSPDRRIRGSVGAIWRPTDSRDRSRPNASLSYSEVFGGRVGVSLNLAYRPHGSIIDMATQAHQQLPIGTTGPAYTHQLTVQDFRNVRTRSGAGLKLDYKWDEQVRFYAKFQLNKHLEHSDHSQVSWQTNQAVATTDDAGNFTGTGGIIPGYTDSGRRSRRMRGRIGPSSRATPRTPIRAPGALAGTITSAGRSTHGSISRRRCRPISKRDCASGSRPATWTIRRIVCLTSGRMG